MQRLLILALGGLVAVTACDSKTEEKKADDKKGDAKGKADDKKADDKKADAKGDAKADEPAAGGPLVLEGLGLKAEAPAGATVGKGIGTETGAMIQAPGLVVSVDIASDSRPKTVEDAKKDADMYTPKNLKDEKLADGWVVTYDNEGGMGKNFFVNVRRDIGGKAYWCDTTASTPEQSAAAVAFCKSLAPK